MNDSEKKAQAFFDQLSTIDISQRSVPFVSPAPAGGGGDGTMDMNLLMQKNRELEHHGRTVTVVAYICFILTLVSSVILSGIFYVSKTLDAERKSFLLSIVGICLLGFCVVMVIARRNSTTLLIFTVLSTFIGGFSLGLSIGYA